MIEGTQALLEKQLNTKGSNEGHKQTTVEMGQVPSGSGDLVPGNGNVTSDPQNNNKRRRRTSKKRQTETPLTETPKPTREEAEDNHEVIPNSFPGETEDTWVKSLWNEVRRANMTKSKRGKAPITEIDLDGKQVHFNIGSRYGEQVSSKSKSKSSKASTMKELPSFLGDGGSDEDVRRVPS